MNTTPPNSHVSDTPTRDTRPAPTGGATRRRLRYGSLTAALLIGVLASVVLANVLASHVRYRVDVTAAGEHRLAPRTDRILERLDGQHEIIVVGADTADSRIRRQVLDVLDVLDRRTPNLRIETIDTASQAGIARYEALLGRLAERDADALDAHARTVREALDTLEAGAEGMRRTGESLTLVRDAIPSPDGAGRALYRQFDEQAAVARVLARELEDDAQTARNFLEQQVGPLALPALDQAADTLRPALNRLARQLDALAGALQGFTEIAGAPQEAVTAARRTLPGIRELRDDAAVAADQLDRLREPDLLRIGRVLRTSSAVLVVGPPGEGLTAVDFDTLFAHDPEEAEGGIRADRRRRAEELFATALGSFTDPDRPIVVVTHAEVGENADIMPALREVQIRLALRGADITQWAVAENPDPPTLSGLNPDGQRPVVYAVLGTFSGDPGRGPGTSGPERVEALGRAIDRITRNGEPMLLSISPSTLPRLGEEDAAVAALAQFGLRADSGRPLIRQRQTGAGREVTPDHRLLAERGDHPLLRAVRGLPTRLSWAIPIHEVEGGPEGRGRVETWPLYTLDDERAWGEARWLDFATFLGSGRQRSGPPAPDQAEDDVDGPWTVALAAERRGGDLDRPQRLVVVGANRWYGNAVLLEEDMVDGRRVALNPGNGDLFESSIYWLAGLDEVIDQSTASRAVALVRPLSDGQIALIRWVLVGALPLSILLLGLVWRLVRG